MRRRPITAHAAGRVAQAGFTLIELMVALVVSSIVILGIFAFSTIQQSTAAIHGRNVRVQQALEGAMWAVASDVRSAGLGFARICSELRVWDPATGQLINPGGNAAPALATVDAVTGERYWALRDGFQAHWNSNGAATLEGGAGTSAGVGSAADSFDVVLGDSTYMSTYGMFELVTPLATGMTAAVVRTSSLLDNGNPAHLEQVQQLYPPGTFFVVTRSHTSRSTNPFRPENMGQCALMQVTGDVQADPGNAQQWQIPIATVSGFNANIDGLMADTNGDVSALCDLTVSECDDWDPSVDNAAGSNVVPLGRLRWSRYELDYTVPTLPYLVRYDLIGYQPATDAAAGSLGTVDYPFCEAGQCNAPQLHLPGTNSPPTAVAIGPMIEDMQVAVGCDGYSDANAAASVMGPVPNSDPGFEEVGPSAGAVLGPNFTIDENASGSQRDSDEWLGNAQAESWAPDCVWHGTAQYNLAAWEGLEGTQNPPPAFRMSPQAIRITLVGSSEFPEEGGGLSTDQVMAVEDRPAMTSTVGIRQRFTITERFTPKNLRWRDPQI
jgi:prepilin-type N-terminal cleavage/methylation domain-containing protein